jgi:hypothetical protein
MTTDANVTPLTEHHETAPGSGGRDLTAALSLASGLTGSALIFLLGNPLDSTTGADITADLLSADARLHAVAWLAALSCAGLILAATRLARAATGTPGRVIHVAGAAVAVLMTAYYASFAAGSGVATNLLTDPGPGLGEATLVVLNAFSLTLPGPALALLAAAGVSVRLPRASRITAALLAVLVLIPFTTWIANLILPAWLGIAAATAATPRRR